MNQIQKTNRISGVFLGSMLMLALQLFSGNANATIIPTDSFGCTQTPTPISTCVGVGFNANNWVGSNKCWIYKINTTGYTSIDMDFSTMKSAAAGPTTGTVSYSTVSPNGPWTTFSLNTYTVSTSCAAKHIDLPVGAEGQSVLYVRAVMTGATANTATNRITSDDVFSGTASATCPSLVGGTVSADINPVCAGTSATLSLTGASGGAGITYVWQSSPNGSTLWADIVPAETGLTYTTPTTLNDTIFYRVKTSCGASSTFSNTFELDVLTVTVGPITGYTNPLIVGTTQTLADTSSNGIWVSSNESSASIDETTGVMTGLFGGTSDISYQVSDIVTGCTASKTITVNTVWPNTLALYAGSTGSNTNVINVPGDTTTVLVPVGFGTLASQCGAGGYSGLTLNPAVDTAYRSNGPHIGYKVYANSGKALNMYRIHARARTSSSGAQKAVIAYQYWKMGTPSGWVVAANTINLVSSDCNVIKNDWDFNTGIPVNPNPTVFGMDSLEVAVYPFAPGTSGGTFQLNQLEVYGVVTSSAACDEADAADSSSPSVVYFCDTMSTFLNANIGTGASVGPGITYQWQRSTTNAPGSYTNITGATGAVLGTDTLAPGPIADTMYYRYQVACSGDNFAQSVPTIVVYSLAPANGGTISGIINGTGALAGKGRMFIDSTYTLTSSVPGGTWSSNDTSVISIDPTSGVATPHIPGDAIFTYRVAPFGCTASSKDTAIALYNGTKALYVGENGNSTNIYRATGVANGTSASLITANWTSGATCGNGGISGLVNTDIAKNDATNGLVGVSIAAATSSFTTTQIRATVRKQPSGAYKAYLGYRKNAGPWTTSAAVNVQDDDCGYSHSEISFPAAVTVDNVSTYDFVVFAYNGVAGPPATTFQVNSISVIGNGAELNKGTGVYRAINSSDVQVYPNPVENTLNIDATQAVNVAIFSIDGKKLLEVKNTKSVDVSTLVSGMYIVTVSDTNNMLLKTDKFVKK
ncbi:T9SS type A sorting domain-containing protein [Taibaiella lutea]|nr:T9SS type A sorting domain-containing protein [Taibaiella lutea]